MSWFHKEDGTYDTTSILMTKHSLDPRVQKRVGKSKLFQEGGRNYGSTNKNTDEASCAGIRGEANNR